MLFRSEVKVGHNWKHAMGQVLAYGLDYPGLEKRIHLFDADNVDLNAVALVCAKFGVVVTHGA